MDILSDVLSALKLKGCLYFNTRFYGPWGIRVPKLGNVARFHLVTDGPCAVRIGQSETVVNLSKGDIIIIPHGKAHILSDKADSPSAALDDALAASNFTGQGLFEYGSSDRASETQLICGHLEFDDAFLHPLIKQLPDCMVVKAKQLEEIVWLGHAIRSLTEIQLSAQMGNNAIVQKLSEIIFIHVIKVWQTSLNTEENFLYAISDPHIGKSLQCFHANPQQKWSLHVLALEAGLSRTLFAERFRLLVGMPPMQYIKQWRVQQAQLLLRESSQSVDQIAQSVGYASVTAFTRIFKKLVGFGPGAYRKQGNNKTVKQ